MNTTQRLRRALLKYTEADKALERIIKHSFMVGTEVAVALRTDKGIAYVPGKILAYSMPHGDIVVTIDDPEAQRVLTCWQTLVNHYPNAYSRPLNSIYLPCDVPTEAAT